MTIATSAGSMNLDNYAQSSVDDKNDIISHAITEHMDSRDAARNIKRDTEDSQQSRRENEERLFIALCDASTSFMGEKNSSFLADCELWLIENTRAISPTTPGRRDVDALKKGDMPMIGVEAQCALFTGWTAPDMGPNFIDVVEGYCVEYYFDKRGCYLGPDEFGVEPTFREMTPEEIADYLGDDLDEEKNKALIDALKAEVAE